MSFSNVLRLSIRNNLGTKTTGFGVFVISNSIKLHFDGKWDFSSGLIEKQKRDTYEKSPRRAIYDRIAQNLSVDDIILGFLQIYISNSELILSSKDIHDSSLILKRSLASNEAIITDVTNMMKYASMKNIKFTSLFAQPDPMAIRMFSKAYVGFESCIAMDCMANFITPYVSSDILLDESAKHLRNIKKLFSVDAQSLKLILADCKNNV